MGKFRYFIEEILPVASACDVHINWPFTQMIHHGQFLEYQELLQMKKI